jgi:hypothetical protein
MPDSKIKNNINNQAVNLDKQNKTTVIELTTFWKLSILVIIPIFRL